MSINVEDCGTIGHLRDIIFSYYEDEADKLDLMESNGEKLDVEDLKIVWKYFDLWDLVDKGIENNVQKLK